MGYRTSPDIIPTVEKDPYSLCQTKLQELLRIMRSDAGLRQADLAQRLGVPQSFVSKYESGERRLDIVEIRQVCQVFGISLAEFVRRFEDSLR